MEEKTTVTDSPDKTQKLGEDFAREVNKGDVVSLIGDLGSGKTTFTQGLAKGLGITGRIISPTFVLLRKHGGDGINLYHIDLYRLNSKEDIAGIGLDEMLEDNNGIFVIEWAKKHDSLKPTWEINFEVEDDDGHKITIKRI